MCVTQPSFDDVEAAGLDGTLRTNGGFEYDWKEIAMVYRAQANRYRLALERIRDEDYRGNRSPASNTAELALKHGGKH